MFKTKIILLFLLIVIPLISFSNSCFENKARAESYNTQSIGTKEGKTAEGDTIPWDVLDGGGGQMCSPNYSIGGSLGQIAPGVGSTATHILWAGYWAGIDSLPEPTYVDLSSFSASGHDGYVEVKWTTATEIDNAGFNLHRGLSKEGASAQLNEGLIPAQGDELQGASYSFVDSSVTNGVTYYYWLEDVDLRGNSTVHGPVTATPTSVEEREETPIPSVYSLAQNYPNPFNTTTQINYGLPVESDVNLTIYNLIGQKVKTLVNEPQTAGYKVAYWDGRNEKGKEVSSGIYFYRLQAGSYTEIKKMVLLK